MKSAYEFGMKGLDKEGAGPNPDREREGANETFHSTKRWVAAKDFGCAAVRSRLQSGREHEERGGMKSAYELAMERLEKSAPTVKLTDEQKAQIAEIDSTYKARIAEKELFLQDKIKQARLNGAIAEFEQHEKQLATEIRRLQEDCEEKKAKVRASTGK